MADAERRGATVVGFVFGANEQMVQVTRRELPADATEGVTDDAIRAASLLSDRKTPVDLVAVSEPGSLLFRPQDANQVYAVGREDFDLIYGRTIFDVRFSSGATVKGLLVRPGYIELTTTTSDRLQPVIRRRPGPPTPRV